MDLLVDLLQTSGHRDRNTCLGAKNYAAISGVVALAIASAAPAAAQRPVATTIDTAQVPHRFHTRDAVSNLPQLQPTGSAVLTMSGDGRRITGVVPLDGGGIVALLESRDPRAGDGAWLLRYHDGARGATRDLPLPRAPNGAALSGHINVVAVGDSLLIAGSWPGSCPDDDRRPERCPGNATFLQPTTGAAIALATHPRDWSTVLGTLDNGRLIVLTQALNPDRGARERIHAVLSIAPVFWRRPATTSPAPDTLFRFRRSADANLLWTHNPTVAASSRHVWVAPTDRPEVFRMGSNGVPALRVSWDAGPRIIPPTALAKWREEEAARIRRAPAEMQPLVERLLQNLAQRQSPSHHPAIADVKTDRAGRVYVREYSLANYPRPADTWLMIGADGALLARIRIPPEMTVLAFDEDRVHVKTTIEREDRMLTFRLGPAPQ